MTSPASDLWRRAKESLQVARMVLATSPDAAASRAYYAAFYAVSALLASQGKEFNKHAAVEAAVHRDLVKTGFWPVDLGQKYSDLAAARRVGDYGQAVHVSAEEASRSISAAADILKAVALSSPSFLSDKEEV